MSVSTCAIIPYGRRYEIERIHYDGPTRIEAVERLLPGPNFEQDTRHDSDQAWVEAEEQFLSLSLDDVLTGMMFI